MLADGNLESRLSSYGVNIDLFPKIDFSEYPGGFNNFLSQLTDGYVAESENEEAKFVHMVAMLTSEFNSDIALSGCCEDFKSELKRSGRAAGDIPIEPLIAASIGLSLIIGPPIKSWLHGIVDRHEIKALIKDLNLTTKEAIAYRALLKTTVEKDGLIEAFEKLGLDPSKWKKASE